MKFLGLKIFIAILQFTAFVLIMPSLIVIGWALFSGEHPLSGQSLTHAAIVIGVVSGVLFMGVVVAAIASLLSLLLAIERNTAAAAENTARIEETQPRTEAPSVIRPLLEGRARLVGAAVLAGGVLVVVLVEAVPSIPGHGKGRANDLAGVTPAAEQNPSNLYSPESVAEYCKTHPTSFYGAVGSPSGVSCPDWARQNQRVTRQAK